MKRIAAAIGGGLTLVGGVLVSSFLYIHQSIETGAPLLDRFAIRGRVAFHALKVFGVRAVTDLRIPRALMAIVHQESRGDPKNYIGDETLGGGPSIGPMQVYRKTAKDLGLWTPSEDAAGDDDAERAEYAELATDEGLGISFGVRTFAKKLDAAQGDIAKAIKAYNGSGPMADTYRGEVLAYADTKTWGLA